MAIDRTKTYCTRGQKLPVRITDKVGEDEDYPIVAAIIFYAGTPESYEEEYDFTEDGRLFTDREHEFDLIECSRWHRIKVDDQVLVRDHGMKQWEKRHFAGVDENDKPRAWEGGLTSWTTDQSYAWDECIRIHHYEEK